MSTTPPGAGRYQTGVPYASWTIAYVAAVPSAGGATVPVRYQPGGGVPGRLTSKRGKSWGRHRIQYPCRGPGRSLPGALTTAAWFSWRLSVTATDVPAAAPTSIRPPGAAVSRSVSALAPAWQRVT